MKRLSGYPNGFYWLLLLALLTVLVTGLVLIPSMLEFKFEWEVVWRLTGEQRQPVAATHTLMSWLLLMLVGALWHAHMRAGWRKRLNRWSGAGSAVLMLSLALTALGLFYFGDEDWQLAASVVHLGLGVGALVLVVIHMASGRRILAKNQRLSQH